MAETESQRFPGIFLECPEVMDFESGLMIRQETPSFFLHQADLCSELKEEERVRIRGQELRIREIKKQGYGRLELRLCYEH